jgi:hypothetical protein
LNPSPTQCAGGFLQISLMDFCAMLLLRADEDTSLVVVKMSGIHFMGIRFMRRIQNMILFIREI